MNLPSKSACNALLQVYIAVSNSNPGCYYREKKEYYHCLKRISSQALNLEWFMTSFHQYNAISLGNDCARYCLLIKGSCLKVTFWFCLAEANNLSRKSCISTQYYKGKVLHVFTYLCSKHCLLVNTNLYSRDFRLMLQLEMLVQAFQNNPQQSFTPTSSILKNRLFICMIDVFCPLMSTNQYHC